jgi:hypothetical protein
MYGAPLKTVFDALGSEGLDKLRKKVEEQSIKYMGKGGIRIFGKFGSRLVPYVGWGLIAYDVAKFCHCSYVCRDDHYTENEKSAFFPL